MMEDITNGKEKQTLEKDQVLGLVVYGIFISIKFRGVYSTNFNKMTDLPTIVLQSPNVLEDFFSRVTYWFSGTIVGIVILTTTINYILTNHIFKEYIPKIIKKFKEIKTKDI